MSDPRPTQDSLVSDGGLNASDTADWAGERTRNFYRTLALYVLPAVFAVLCVLGGIALIYRNPFATKSTADKPVAAAPVSDKDMQIAQLESQIATLRAQTANPALVPQAVAPGQVVAGTVPAAVTPVYPSEAALINQLSARIDRLESSQRALAHAAAAAQAALELARAAHTSEPFMRELSAAEPAVADPTLTAPLRAVADKGVWSEPQLTVKFPEYAAKANIDAKTDDGDNSLFNHARHALGSFISVRRIDKDSCKGVQGALQCAETHLDNGDLNGALTFLDTLPPTGKKALKPWLDQARARNLVDATTQRITTQALNRLASANEAPAAGGAQ
jgi:hypothetical protein